MTTDETGNDQEVSGDAGRRFPFCRRLFAYHHGPVARRTTTRPAVDDVINAPRTVEC